MGNKKLRIGLMIFLIMLVLLAYATAVALYGLTVVTWWIPWGVCAALGLISGLTMWRLWRWLTNEEGFWLNYLVHVGTATGIMACLFFGINYVGADTDAIQKETVTVETKYRKEHHRTQRVGRRHYRQGSAWYDYHIDIRFEDGRQKSITVPLKRYNRLRTGSTTTVSIAPGFFHIPVIR